MKTKLLTLTPEQFCMETSACSAGRKFAMQFQTMTEVWDNCTRVDWLVWILYEIDADKDEKTCRLFMVWCARNTPLANGQTISSLLTDIRSVAALDVAERFANGLATDNELSAAEAAARSAARSAAEAVDYWHTDWTAAWYAALSAAGSAARSAAWSAAEAVAWYAAWSAARSAAGSAARSAARSAAEAAQVTEFKRVVKNPFLK